MKLRDIPQIIFAVILAGTLTLAVPAVSKAANKEMAVYSGPAKKFGTGSAKSYVKLEKDKIVEIGFQFSESALQSLKPGPKWQPGHQHEVHDYILELPKEAGQTPFHFLELDWNPGGHEPPGIYDTPHLDFHFYTISKAERDAIDPADPDYMVKAARQPAAELIPANFILPAPPPATLVPRMGVHWIDANAPELHGQPFTQTFIRGAWNGRVAFIEPMISKAYLETKPNVVLKLAQPRCFERPGAYPTQYGIRYDQKSREYNVYLTGFEERSCKVSVAAAD